jgi:hypothetical protein
MLQITFDPHFSPKFRRALRNVKMEKQQRIPRVDQKERNIGDTNQQTYRRTHVQKEQNQIEFQIKSSCIAVRELVSVVFFCLFVCDSVAF